jgi:hypothetical protein
MPGEALAWSPGGSGPWAGLSEVVATRARRVVSHKPSKPLPRRSLHPPTRTGFQRPHKFARPCVQPRAAMLAKCVKIWPSEPALCGHQTVRIAQHSLPNGLLLRASMVGNCLGEQSTLRRPWEVGCPQVRPAQDKRYVARHVVQRKLLGALRQPSVDLADISDHGPNVVQGGPNRGRTILPKLHVRYKILRGNASITPKTTRVRGPHAAHACAPPPTGHATLTCSSLMSQTRRSATPG